MSKDYEGCLNFNSKIQNKDAIESKAFQSIREYGPLQIDWSGWITKNDNHLVASRNQQGKELYIALNCIKEKINVTGKDREWKGWFSPELPFEKRLLNDLCLEKGF